jgi:threonine/homoserine/homoserine lactone efflux protein
MAPLTARRPKHPVGSLAEAEVVAAVDAVATELVRIPRAMIISHSSLLLFVTGAAILLVIPGPAVFYIVSRSIGHGRAAGLMSALGITAGTLFHVAAATLGLSALLASSAVAFQFVKYLGAAYLIYLGVRVLRSERAPAVDATSGERRLSRIFGQGLLVNLLNPKTALFFLAFLPQFVDPGRGHATLQIFQLGVLFAFMGLCSDSMWGLLAGTLAERLRGSVRLRRAQRNVSGGVLIALGVATAFSGARSK